jgi:hypothetical protein
MNDSAAGKKNIVSDDERALLRRSVRALLAGTWPADKAVENSENAPAIAEFWAAMARQGLSSLGCNPAEGGLREILIVFEELGRASCPAPLLGAVAANLALTTLSSNAARAVLDDLHLGKALIALGLGTFDGDAAAGAVAARGETLTGRRRHRASRWLVAMRPVWPCELRRAFRYPRCMRSR